MIKKLNACDADIIVYQIPTSTKGTIPCGYSTNNGKLAREVRHEFSELADSLRSWYKPEIAESVKREEKALFSTQSIHRRVYAPMLNALAGIMCNYDHRF